jgi:hypothetical protein
VQKVFGSADRKVQKRQGESRNHLYVEWQTLRHQMDAEKSISLFLEVCGFSAVIYNPFTNTKTYRSMLCRPNKAASCFFSSS